MDQLKQSKFSVIELFGPPYKDSNKYVCVPNSWIRFRKSDDGIGMALVKFPKEKLSETKKRVKKEENFSDDWSFFLADVKYSTDSYTDANEYITILDKIFIQEQRCSKEVPEEEPSVSNNKICDSSQESKTKEICATSDPLNNDPELMNNQTTSQQLKAGTSELGAKEVGPADSTDKTKRYLKRPSLRMSSPNNNSRLLDQIEKLTFEETSKSVKKSGKVEHNKEKAPPVKTPPELTNKSGILSALQSLLGDSYKEILENLHSNFENNHKLLNSLQLIFHKNCELLKKLIDIVKQDSDGDQIDHNVAIKELKNHIVRGANTKTNNVESNERKTGLEVQNGDKNVTGSDNGKDDKNSNPLNKIRGQARKFTLPPEYDPNNSKWSLKHRKKAKGLVELIPQSGVYVDAIKLGNCKRMSKDSKTLARMLLVEVFSESALSVCSLTGQKANAFDSESIRPGLDEHARTVLLNYVEQYASDNKWVKLQLKQPP